MFAMFNAPPASAARFRIISLSAWLAAALLSLAIACADPAPAPAERPAAEKNDAAATEETAPERASANIAPTLVAPTHTAIALNTPPAAAPTRAAIAMNTPPPTPTHGAEDAVVEVGDSHGSIIDDGFVSLDERILRAEIIAIATMKSVKAYAKPYFVNKHMPTLEFTFDAHQYLKGEGSGSLVVILPLAYEFYDAESEAVERGKEWIAQDRWWDDRPSLIFLQPVVRHLGEVAAKVPASGPKRYEFTPLRNDSAASYAMAIEPFFIDSFSIRSERNRVWLPSSAPASAALNMDSANAGDTRFLLGEPLDGAFGHSDLNPDALLEAAAATRVSSDISLSDLRSRIKAMEDLVSEGEGAEGYAKCLIKKKQHERSGYTPRHSEFHMDSGLPAGSVFADAGLSGGNAYRTFYFKGPHGHLFEKIRIDSNDNPTDGYRVQSKNKRPLPKGRYELESYSLHPVYLPCNYEPISQYWTIHVVPPAGTLHEAFFDPASIGSGAGADGENGVLKPTAFSLDDGTSAALESVKWQSQTVEMRFAPHNRLANHHADFIALDGTVSLRLDFDDATETGEGASRALSWDVCAQPWQAGDLLMLRISESQPDLTGVSRDADCVSATATPETPTATPISDTPTATPEVPTPEMDTPTPTATPEMDTPTPTATPISNTPTATPTPDTPTPTPTPELDAPTPTPTPESDTPTPTAMPEPDTPMATATPETDTPTPTATPIPDTPTPTPTPEPDTPMATATPETDTPTPTPEPAG